MLSELLGVRIFDIEAAGACNLACPFCPRDQLPPVGMMTEETFDRFLDHVPLGASDSLAFVGIGEPTLNRALPSFIQKAKTRYPRLMNTWVTTNGTLLNTRVLPPLLDAGLDTLDVSFNGLNAEDYERMMLGAKFDKVLANLSYAASEVAQRGHRTCLQVNFIITQENANDEEAIKAFWRARGITQFRIQYMHNRGGLTKIKGMTDPDQPGLKCSSCQMFEVMPLITWEGDVLYCSHDIPRNHKIGNIRRHSWKEIDQRKRRIIRERLWPAMCSACTDPQRHDMRQKINERIRSEVKGRIGAGVQKTFSRIQRMVRPQPKIEILTK